MSCEYCLNCKIDDKLEEWSKTRSIATATEICEMLVAAKILMEVTKKEGDSIAEQGGEEASL